MILLSGEVQTFLAREVSAEIIHLDYLDQAGCIFCQHAIFTTKKGINYGLRVMKTARFISISRIPIYTLRKKLPILEKEVQRIIQKVERYGLPMLDYQIQRQLEDHDGTKLPF